MDRDRIIEIAKVLYNKGYISIALDLSIEELQELSRHAAEVGCEITRLFEEEINNLLSYSEYHS